MKKQIVVLLLSFSVPFLTPKSSYAAEETNETSMDSTGSGEESKEPYLGTYSRPKKHPFDLYGYFRTVDGDTDFDLGTIDDSGFVGGVGFGVQMSDYLDAYTEVGFGSLDSTISNSSIKFDTDVFEWNLGLNYNVLKRRITPVINPMIGFMNQSGDVNGVDFSEWVLTYGVGAGVRWDISDRWLASVMYQVTWSSFDDSNSLTMYQGVLARIGFKF